MMSDMAGNRLVAVTNSFGFFHFDEVPTGGTYIVSVTSRKFSIDSRLVEVNSDVSDLTFVARRR